MNAYFELALKEISEITNEVLTLNIEKLKLRYPEKFSEEKAIDRNVEAERELLEKDFERTELKRAIKCDNAKKEFIVGNYPNNNTAFKEIYLNRSNGITDGRIETETWSTKEPKPPITNIKADTQCLSKVLLTDDIKIEKLTFNSPKQPSKQARDWLIFSKKVLTHIEEYAVPQYGDKGSNEITDWTVEQVLKSVQKRIARYGRQSREGQQELDFLKMAHEVQIAWDKYLTKMSAEAEQEMRDTANEAH